MGLRRWGLGFREFRCILGFGLVLGVVEGFGVAGVGIRFKGDDLRFRLK